MIKVLLADDHQIVLDGLSSLFEEEEDIEKVQEVTDGELVLKFLHSPLVNYEAYLLNFSDRTFVTLALHAIEKRYSFQYGFISTVEQVSEEAEALASKILKTHIHCRLRLNSELKALQRKFAI